MRQVLGTVKAPLVKTMCVHCIMQNQQTPAFMVPVNSILKPPCARGTGITPFTEEERGRLRGPGHTVRQVTEFTARPQTLSNALSFMPPQGGQGEQ